jgi:hypothetical protein
MVRTLAGEQVLIFVAFARTLMRALTRVPVESSQSNPGETISISRLPDLSIGASLGGRTV